MRESDNYIYYTIDNAGKWVYSIVLMKNTAKKSMNIYVKSFAALAVTAIGFYLLLSFSGWILRPDVSSGPEAVDPYDLALVDSLRDQTLDNDNPPQFVVDVDYSEGKKAAWYPKNESPIIKELVAEGVLPPLVDRIGTQPVVVKAVEGIGKYGGTWIRILNAAPSEIAHRMSYANLVRFSPYGDPVVPHIARKIDVSGDSRVYTIHLRQGIRWSDGHPFTSADLMFWWHYDALDTMQSDGRGGVFKTRNEPAVVDSIDKYTLKVTLAYPNGLLMQELASFWGKFMLDRPAHFCKKYHPRTGDPDFIAKEMETRKVASSYALYSRILSWQNPERPTLSPWIFNTYRSNPPYEFVRNPYYFMVDEEGNQLPYVDRLVIDARKNEMISIAAGNGEITMQSAFIMYDQYTNLMRNRKTKGYELYHWYCGDGSQYVITPNLNYKVTPGNVEEENKANLMREADFRRALSLAINRQDIIDAEYNGQTSPAQVAPGTESFFHDSTLFNAYTEFDPERADELLDGLGLTKRDASGYRMYADGTPMLFYILFTAYTGAGPAQFVVDDWARVGIRVLPRERSVALFTNIRRARKADFVVGIANGEYYPILEPYNYIPVHWWTCTYALSWATWVSRGGMLGDPEADKYGEPVPKDHPFYQALLDYDRLKLTHDIKEQREIFRPILKLAGEQLWTINISTPPPTLVIVKNGFHNVPRKCVSTWPFQTPGNAGIETYYFDKNEDTPATIASIKNSLVDITPAPQSLTAITNEIDSDGGIWINWIVGILVVVLLIISMIKQPYIARRLVIMIPTLLVISVISFFIIQLPPGDFITSKIAQLEETGEGANEQLIEDYKLIFFLDDSVPVKYMRWLGVYWFGSFEAKDRGLLQGNLGTTMEGMESVNSKVGDRIMLTFLIAFGTIMFTWILAIPIGIYSAVRQYSVMDYILTFIGFIGMCFPAFLLALILMAVGGVSGLFSSQYGAQVEWDLPKIIDLLKHIWIPIVVLGVGGTAGMIRVMRGNLLDELKKPYVVTAMAKGVRPMKLLFKYPVRLALNPFISGIGGLFPMLISGNAIVAMVLSLPTVGPLMLNALMSEDMYLAGSMLMVLSTLGIVGTLVSDLLLLWLDPRIRFKSGSR